MNKSKILCCATIVASMISLSACGDSKEENEQAMLKIKEEAMQKELAAKQAAQLKANPFGSKSTLYMQFPPFDKIKNSDYGPVFTIGMAEQLAEINAIAENPQAATFDNTLVALEKSGQKLDRVSSVFFAMTSAHINDDLKALRSEVAPKLAQHRDAILLNPKLFARIKAVYDQLANLNLDPEAKRLVEETHRDFIVAGAQLSPEDKDKLKAYNQELATLTTKFSENVLEEVNSKAIFVTNVRELSGLTDTQIGSAAEAAKARGVPEKYVLPLLNTSQQPSLSSLKNRQLRERILKESLSRGSSGGKYDNRSLISKVFKLRAERAKLLGYPNQKRAMILN